MQQIAELQQLFSAYLNEKRLLKEPVALYAPVNYIMSIGGKRMRPIMCLLACQCFDPDVSKALPAALSVETFHNFSLVHDDIMDQAPLRRGQPTVHAKYGLNSGVLAGDVMLIYAYEYLQLSPLKHNISDMVSTLSKVAIKVCEGQQYDIDFEQRKDVSLPEYLLMIEMKTAALLAGSLELGALAADAPAKDRHHLSEFGRLTGIAFQIQDDYLDTFGDPLKFGKRVGGDIAQNKKTCLIIKALELASPDVKAELEQLYQQAPNDEKDEAKINRVISIFRELGIPGFLKELRNTYQKQAYIELQQVNADEAAKKILFNLAESLLVREL
jgi:geranylgeranyl diphosphate synthase type II